MTEQPKWKFIANLGDASPLDYGGYFIYEDETGVAEAELLMEPGDLEPPDDDPEGPYEVYRFSLDRCKMKQGYLIPYTYESTWPHALSQYEEWFAEDLASVASFIGSTEDELQEWFCSADPIDRANAYRAIGDYHGYVNLDSYPIMLTRADAEERYKDGEL